MCVTTGTACSQIGIAVCAIGPCMLAVAGGGGGGGRARRLPAALCPPSPHRSSLRLLRRCQRLHTRHVPNYVHKHELARQAREASRHVIVQGAGTRAQCKCHHLSRTPTRAPSTPRIPRVLDGAPACPGLRPCRRRLHHSRRHVPARHRGPAPPVPRQHLRIRLGARPLAARCWTVASAAPGRCAAGAAVQQVVAAAVLVATAVLAEPAPSWSGAERRGVDGTGGEGSSSAVPHVPRCKGGG